MSITYQKYISPKTHSTNNVPVTIEWLGSRMIRNHSLRATCKEVLTIAESVQAVKIDIIGNPGTGKSELSRSIAHLLHTMSDVPYAVKILDRESLLNFEATIKSLTPNNWILIFDDVSYLGASASKQQIEILKKVMTEIRHMGGTDVRIISIYNVHYSYALSKGLRNSAFTFFTSVASNETENMIKTLGVQNTQKITEFKRITQQALLKKKFAIPLGKKKFFIYNYRAPFAPSLFYNGMSLRTIVFPKREAIDKLCGICVSSQSVELKDGLNLEDFAKQMKSKFGEQIGRNAVRIVLSQAGINVWPKRVKQAMQFMNEYMLKRVVNLQQIADYYDYDVEPTRLDAKIDNLDVQYPFDLAHGPPEDNNE